MKRKSILTDEQKAYVEKLRQMQAEVVQPEPMIVNLIKIIDYLEEAVNDYDDLLVASDNNTQMLERHIENFRKQLAEKRT